ncbi:unnamed protein product [Lepeophtheirus salmonis]|uniref:(salmon louse) hypothetical protein n=1 Tax=Lepeophtheirus salmonis TaxID=72036 RepID=A0A7R8D9U0_LEPSM|nr:unnamed protein product [Lepeophtheirus salmonis]CAF3020789.1 unnamed protein product [Lepeophtheirus salmonis]
MMDSTESNLILLLYSASLDKREREEEGHLPFLQPFFGSLSILSAFRVFELLLIAVYEGRQGVNNHSSDTTHQLLIEGLRGWIINFSHSKRQDERKDLNSARSSFVPRIKRDNSSSEINFVSPTLPPPSSSSANNGGGGGGGEDMVSDDEQQPLDFSSKKIKRERVGCSPEYGLLGSDGHSDNSSNASGSSPHVSPKHHSATPSNLGSLTPTLLPLLLIPPLPILLLPH